MGGGSRYKAATSNMPTKAMVWLKVRLSLIWFERVLRGWASLRGTKVRLGPWWKKLQVTAQQWARLPLRCILIENSKTFRITEWGDINIPLRTGDIKSQFEAISEFMPVSMVILDEVVGDVDDSEFNKGGSTSQRSRWDKKAGIVCGREEPKRKAWDTLDSGDGHVGLADKIGRHEQVATAKWHGIGWSSTTYLKSRTTRIIIEVELDN
ncbi:hypothetical protein HPP92_027682 [Vanilla planifolia]|uniref:Uncharacterized protein n=1 Tax=Vanilla planifolia TaxID=51239 RepID=A0A835PBI9_VANPL|nr:hypothetical protein HPP92_027682 [Vanilla planifolia]